MSNLYVVVAEAKVRRRELIYAFKHKIDNIPVIEGRTFTRVSSEELLSHVDLVCGSGRGQATTRGKHDLWSNSLA